MRLFLQSQYTNSQIKLNVNYKQIKSKVKADEKVVDLLCLSAGVKSISSDLLRVVKKHKGIRWPLVSVRRDQKVSS